jgi:hypothetical protein
MHVIGPMQNKGKTFSTPRLLKMTSHPARQRIQKRILRKSPLETITTLVLPMKMKRKQTATGLYSKFMDKINYREALFDHLKQPKCGLGQDSLNKIFFQFDRISKLRGEAYATELLMEQFGNADTQSFLKGLLESHGVQINYRLPQSQVGKFIEDNLELANQQKIKTSPASRIADIVKRYNENIHKCSATLRNSMGFFEVLSPDELIALEMKVPKRVSEQQQTYEAWGSVKKSFHLDCLQFENEI